MQFDVDIDGFVTEPFLIVPNLLDLLPRDVADQIRRDGGRTAGFTDDDDSVGGRHRFRRDTGIGIGAQIRIDDGIRNLVADFIGVAFRHGFAGKQEILQLGLGLGGRGGSGHGLHNINIACTGGARTPRVKNSTH